MLPLVGLVAGLVLHECVDQLLESARGHEDTQESLYSTFWAFLSRLAAGTPDAAIPPGDPSRLLRRCVTHFRSACPEPSSEIGRKTHSLGFTHEMFTFGEL